MNFTGSNTLPNIGRRRNWLIVVLAGGLAAAISAAALAGVFDRGTTQETTTVVQPVAPVNSAPFVPAVTQANARPMVYIVDSRVQAAEYEAALPEDLASGNLAAPVGAMSFLVIDSADSQQLLSTVIGEQIQTGAFDVIDLRD